MYVEDQDDEVEEEEEFHEVEEEKHKSSQESVGDSCGDKIIISPSRSNKHNQQQQQELQQEPQEQKELKPEQESMPEDSNEIKLDEKVDAISDENKSSDIVEHKQELSNDTAVLHENEQSQTSPDLSSRDVPTEIISTNTVDDSSHNETETPEKVALEKPNDSGIDWANIMLNSKATNDDSPAENLSSDKEQSNGVEEPQTIADASADDTIDGIIKETNEKLKIYDGDSTLDESVHENNEKSITAPVESPAAAAVESTQVVDSNEAQDLDTVSKEEEADSIVEKSDQCEPGPSADDSKIEPVDEVEKKELDLDEDVKNPQYIPKKGVFYEHDDRSHDVEEKKSSPMSNKKEDDTAEVKENSANKKATCGEKQVENRRSNRRQRTDADRWNHDLFRNEKQKPKSKSELINAYGYDIRQERGARNQTDNRAPRTNNNTTNSDRPQEGQRARQARDVRAPRQNQTTTNRSRERRPRRQNSRGNRGENSQATVNRREAPVNRSSKPDNTKDLRETLNEKHAAQEAAAAASASAAAVPRRDQEIPNITRNSRNDSRGRRRTSRDRPSNDESRLPPPNTVMPPITTWSSEDMMKAEAFGKKSPSRVQPQSSATINSITSAAQRDRSTDFWQQNQPNKNVYPDRSTRNQDEIRHQHHYNSRGRYQERGDENHRPTQFIPRNQFNDRSNQHHDWNRAGNFSPYAKSNDYIVKTQTFENSRLSQGNVNRANNNRDLREVIDRRVQHSQQNFQNKVQHPVDHHMNQRGPVQGHYHHQYAQQSHHYMHQHQQPMAHGQQHMQQSQSPQQSVANNHNQHHQHQNQHQHQQHQQPHQHQHQNQHQHQQQQQLQHQQQQQLQQSQHQSQRPQQQSPQQAQQASNETQQRQQPPQPNPQTQQQRQPPTTQAAQPQTHTGQSRQNLAIDNGADNGQDSARLTATNNNDLINSRPIIKTDTYNGGGMAAHSQHLSQHSQNHRSMGGPMTQPETGAANSHLVPTHLGSGVTQAQYYTPSSSSRDPSVAAAALATAYHGYLPGGHPVMDPSRYHMTSQQLSDHGYITSSGQTNDVAAGSVLHQQGLYTDTSAGGTLANSAYLAQSGATLSPTTNIPVTGAGPQSLPPVPYIQHSQYPPPPYSNPYSQPQHNQVPPQSGHAYPPYWAYI